MLQFDDSNVTFVECGVIDSETSAGSRVIKYFNPNYMNKLVIMYSLLNLSLFSFAACSDVASLSETEEEKNVISEEVADVNLRDEKGGPLDARMAESFVVEDNL